MRVAQEPNRLVMITHVLSTIVVCCRYAAPLYVDIKKSIITRQPDGEEEEIDEMYPKTFLGRGVAPAIPQMS